MLETIRGCQGASGDVRGVRSVLGLAGECRYSGARRDIGGIGGIGGLLGSIGIVGAVGGMRGVRGARGVLGSWQGV